MVLLISAADDLGGGWRLIRIPLTRWAADGYSALAAPLKNPVPSLSRAQYTRHELAHRTHTLAARTP
ncbi:hypothetical protein AB0R12_06230 [Streptomyces niveus]|uniref:hypothetical protein n=1 Tax=Streptomyces niveus TaxID=193462 RepID=UPI0034471623